MDGRYIEIGLFLLAQTGLLLWTLSDIRSDVKNLTTWVTRIDALTTANGKNVAYLQGHDQSSESKN